GVGGGERDVDGASGDHAAGQQLAAGQDGGRAEGEVGVHVEDGDGGVGERHAVVDSAPTGPQDGARGLVEAQHLVAVLVEDVQEDGVEHSAARRDVPIDVVRVVGTR